MEKSYNQIVGMPVIVEGMGKYARVTDILIDHEDGKVACLFVDKGKMKIVAPIDILYFGQAITIHDPEDVIDAHDLIKAHEVIKRNIRIMKSKVETKKGESLGHVQDYFIDVKAFGLTKILVYKSFLGLFKSSERLISARDIIEIKKDLIIVNNKCARQFMTIKKEAAANFYPDLAS